MKNWSIKLKLGLGFAVTLLITVILSVVGISNANTINNMLNSMYENNLVPVADVANTNMQAI